MSGPAGICSTFMVQTVRSIGIPKSSLSFRAGMIREFTEGWDLNWV